jgi:4-hydroxy-3-methylbut-2-enyl diphosphate reductase
MSIAVVVANPHGICGNDQGFGVAHAIYLAKQTAKGNLGKTYILGEIVHNQHVVDSLEKDWGVKTVHALEEIPEDATMVIRSHGATPQTYQKAKERGLKVIDATCPLVAQAHKEVKKLARVGKKVLYIASEKTHDEAVGVASEAPETVTLTTLQQLDKVKLEDPENTVVLTQTTLSALETAEELEKLKKRYPQVTIRPHICPATTDRQKAVIKLAKDIGFVVIVGSPTSSNSNRLKEVAQVQGAQAYIVDTAAELNPEWFAGVKKVAVSSGASTPEELLDEVVKKIKTF